ncbi:MAG: tRNA 2-thiouridine(34) synthase MnmA [Planctomycetia bacterium]|nr:tRNA 2-thiouridine(34) synthase MnmA [Planctomycetia bacterium]
MSRVVLAMSGGVDSSVAACLLRQAGHEVIGIFMRHGEAHQPACAASVGTGADAAIPSGAAPAQLPVISSRPWRKQGCCTAADAADARRVADRLDIPFYALDFRDEFGQIMDYFVAEYTAGRTPNPCVVCNNWLKFGALAEYADSVKAEHIATGHYARLERRNDEDVPALLRGVDPSKDQSYVLFGVNREILRRVLLPVGDYRKPEIRAIAKELGLRVADKEDSQEICFVTDGDYAAFVRRRRGDVDLSGEIVTTDGEVVGRHAGIENFTIGQRKGLGLAFGAPRYVVRLEPDTRRVVIGTRDELAVTRLAAKDVNWLIDPPREPFRCSIKIRYLSQPVMATVTPQLADRFIAQLDEPKHGVAPGQAAVCYDGNRVLGGGWIE